MLNDESLMEEIQNRMGEPDPENIMPDNCIYADGKWQCPTVSPASSLEPMDESFQCEPKLAA